MISKQVTKNPQKTDELTFCEEPTGLIRWERIPSHRLGTDITFRNL